MTKPSRSKEMESLGTVLRRVLADVTPQRISERAAMANAPGHEADARQGHDGTQDARLIEDGTTAARQRYARDRRRPAPPRETGNGAPAPEGLDAGAATWMPPSATGLGQDRLGRAGEGIGIARREDSTRRPAEGGASRRPSRAITDVPAAMDDGGGAVVETEIAAANSPRCRGRAAAVPLLHAHRTAADFNRAPPAELA